MRTKELNKKKLAPSNCFFYLALNKHKKISKKMLFSLLFSVLLLYTSALDNSLGRTPLLGFNSWNIFACSVNETKMRTTMDAFVSLGLRDAGYDTVSVDDCWVHSRDSHGAPVADPSSFPNGMAALATYAHDRSLKFGLYSSNSPLTCDQRPGSFGYETIDAQTYAEWGVDLLKYDNCGDQHTIGPPERGYSVMRDALNATGRPIFFSACEWAVDFPSTWMMPVANQWRTTYDIQNLWECVVPHVDWQNVFADYFGPGGFGDMDILEVGNGVLTPDEGKAHFSLWAVMKSPLLIGCDLTTSDCISNVTLFTNPEMLAISQDKLGLPARRVWSIGDKGLPYGKSGVCGTEELPQNTIIQPCDSTDPFQIWKLETNGSIISQATNECLQLDSGQGGHCSQNWDVWTNNVASSLCNDPASSCGGRQEFWSYDATARTLVNNASGQCLTVHSALINVGTLPCDISRQGMQTWDWVSSTQQFISSVTPSSGIKSCLARTKDVLGGAEEIFAGPLSGGDVVILFFNRNVQGYTNITADFGFIPGLGAGKSAKIRDVWERTDLGTVTGSITATSVPPHGVAVYRATPL